MKTKDLSSLIKGSDFVSLFRLLGWDNPEQQQSATVVDSDLRPKAIADKRGITAWLVDCPSGLPKRSEQHRVVRHIRRLSRDQLVIFVATDEHLWLWPEQNPSGVGYRLVGYECNPRAPSESLLQRLKRASFTVDEEDRLTSSSVLTRVRRSFNADKVTKSFYREFQKHHKKFTMKVEGIPVTEKRRWYASVLLNRLMFTYFIQQKGFLDGDRGYLRNRLDKVREHYGADKFYVFYRQFLLTLFHEGLGRLNPDYADSDIKAIIGNVPYVNGGIFYPHDLEKIYDIQIKDEAFESLFNFFDQWRWHLDENPTGAPNEINPDILGFIFEQYINFTEKGQKEKGAYYTKPDVTGYMAASTILPALADKFTAAGLDDPCRLLPNSEDNYIYDSILHGVDKPLPDGCDVNHDNPPEELTLPGERWCDVIHRRQRCDRLREILLDVGRKWIISDVVTENLDIQGLLADYLVQLSTADECDKAFEALRSLTVCDPTVGSGAFLFAALEVLDPLYSAVLGRAAELEEKYKDRPAAACLLEARKHPSERYWMLKTLCLNNLYGVDIMGEAPEIAKLRLFLKLVAQIDDVDSIEPLPDLDFNIKSGNLLVGIADEGDVRRRLGEGRLDLSGEISGIKQVAEQVADVYDAFISDQSAHASTSDYTVAKQKLSTQLGAVRNLADILLYKLRLESANASPDEWRSSHQPFHWFVEFPSVWRRGGFDVLIGNPPYINVKEVKDYRLLGYETQSCPNLYAVCMERTSSLLKDKGWLSMVVMHSLCFSGNFAPIRKHLQTALGSIWVSSYSRASDSLFSGSAKVRNSIVVATPSVRRGLFVTQCHRWFASSRANLMPGIEYVSPPDNLLSNQAGPCWPFATGPKVTSAFSKMKRVLGPVKGLIKKGGDFRVGVKTTASNSIGVYDAPPPSLDPTTKQPVMIGDTTKWLHFNTSREADLVFLSFLGRWAYLWWLMYGDEYHVTAILSHDFPCGVDGVLGLASQDKSVEKIVVRLEELAKNLKSGMANSVEYNLRGSGPDRVLVGRYNLMPFRQITDEADLLFARLWGVEDAYRSAGNLRDRMVFGGKG